MKNTTAWNGTTWVDGSMTNKSNSTTAASTVTEDGSNAKIQIPASGYYDANNSYITVPVETLKKEVSALNSSSFTVAAQTNASEAIYITASMAAPESGYYKIESCNAGWDQTYMDVQLNTNTYTYVAKGQIIGVRIIKSSGVYGRFTAKLS